MNIIIEGQKVIPKRGWPVFTEPVFGELEESPRDIGNLIREVQADIEKECKEEIKELLWKFFWRKANRGVTAGLAEWYKERLAKEAF